MNHLKEVLLAHKDEYIKYLQELVAIDTQDLGHGIKGGLEKKGQEYIENLLLSMKVDRLVKDPMTEEAITWCMKNHQEGNTGHNYDDRYNVYATFKGEGGKSLMFNGHMDTMPPGEVSAWNHAPHDPVIEDGKLYGLGVADMKGGLMASIMAVKLLQDANISLPGDVVITSVCDEEGGGNGSMQAIYQKEKADGVIVCEGTSHELIAAHMGFVFFQVKIEGRANHSGAKWLGVSAIDKAMKLITALNELEHRWLLTYKHPLLPAPNLNVGTIMGGSAGSTVPGNCQFETCIHYLPGFMTHDQVVKEFTDTIDRVCQGDEWLIDHRPEVSMYQAGGAFEMDLTHPFVSDFTRAYELTTERPLKIVGSPAGCDSRLWRNIAQCPTLQFGPGNLAQCHSVNEYLSIDAYLETILVYAGLILTWGSNQ